MKTTATPRKRAANAASEALAHHPGLYRATLSCRIGCAAIEGTSEPPSGVRPSDYALFNLIKAVEEIAVALAVAQKPAPPPTPPTPQKPTPALSAALKTMRDFSAWRLGADTTMIPARDITAALVIVIAAAERVAQK